MSARACLGALGSPRSALVRAFVLAIAWWAMTGGAEEGYVFGLLMVGLALMVAARMPDARTPKWSAIGLARFALYFLGRSIVAGVDVARMALAPRLQVSPTIARHRLRLPPGPGRNLFMGTLSLMPGTLAMNVEGGHLEVHVLADADGTIGRDLDRLEAAIARASGERLEDSHA